MTYECNVDVRDPCEGVGSGLVREIFEAYTILQYTFKVIVRM